MKIAPQEFHQGDVVHVVLERLVSKVRFDPIDRDNPAGDQKRVHVFGVQGATIVDASVVKEHLDQQKRRIEMAVEAAAGVGRLPTEENEQDLREAHGDGLHASGLVPGCPQCTEEAEAAAAEGGTVSPLKRGRGRKADG